MRIFAHVTADQVTPESAAYGGYELSGWVDSIGDRDIMESRNYVAPLINRWIDDPELPDEIRSLGLEQAEDNGDGTFYFQDEHPDYETGATYTYAVHFTQKYLTSKGYVERGWHPSALVKELS